MSWIMLAIVFLVAAVFAPRRIPDAASRMALRAVLGIIAVFLVFSTSYVHIGADEVGHLKKIYFGRSLLPGKIIAANGEKGPQAEILPPGFHFRPLLNVMYDVEERSILEIPEGRYGFVTARDGLPLRKEQFLTDGWPEREFVKMVQDAAYFLKKGGQKGPQLTVLKPGRYRINQYLFQVKLDGATNIAPGTVGVIKSNVQERKDCKPVKVGGEGALSAPLVPKNCIGVWNEPLFPGKYYLNRRAYEVTIISTRVRAWTYKGGYTRRRIDLTLDQDGKITQRLRSKLLPVPRNAVDSAILIRVEGWEIPLELRVLVQIMPENAPFVVASVGGIEKVEDSVLTPALRSVVRNVLGAKGRKVLELQDKRAELEALVETRIRPEGAKAGISIKEVRFADPVIPPVLLVTWRREQLAERLTRTYQREQVAQQERIKTENTRARADRQPQLVGAEIAVKVAEQRKQAAKLEGEGEKLRLLEIAAGQRAQAEVLGKDRVMQLALLEKMLAAAVKNPALVKVPNVLVQGAGSGLAGAAAILGNSNLVQGLVPRAPKEGPGVKKK